MTIKQTLLASALFCGISLSAAGPVLNGNNSGLEISQLSLRKKLDQKNAFKFKKSAFSGSGREWEESEVTSSGLFLNLGLFFPPTSYVNYDFDSEFDPKYKLGFNFELGNYFRFAKIADGKFGVGLRATWLSLGYTKASIEKDVYRVAEISLVRVGPQFGIALNEKMGLDAFYQLGFNLTSQFGDVDTGNEETIGVSSSYMGVSNEIGAAFHYQVYSLGFGYRFGKVTNFLNVVDGETLDSDFLDDKKSSVNSLRVTLGFKF